MWRLLENGAYSLAYHLQRAIEAKAPPGDREAQPPAALLRMLALAPHVQRPYGEVVDAIGVVPLEAAEDGAVRLLVWAAAARPALMAPATGGSPSWSSCGSGMPPLSPN